MSVSRDTKAYLWLGGIVAFLVGLLVLWGWVIRDTDETREGTLFLAGFLVLSAIVGIWIDRRNSSNEKEHHDGKDA